MLLALAGGRAASATGTDARTEDLRVLARTHHAVVGGPSGAKELAERVGAIVDECAPRIAPVVGTTDLRPIPTLVYLDHPAFTEAVGLSKQSHVVGIAKLPTGALHIDGSELLAAIKRVVPHEVGHVLIARAVGPGLRELPLWLNEGIAEYVAGQRAAQVDPVSLRAIGRGSAVPLSDLDAAFARGGSGARLAYAESASLVNFLVDRHGEEVISGLLAALRGGADFEAALRYETGLTVAELEAAWQKDVTRRWRWPLLFRSPVLFYVIMLGLFLVGLLRWLIARRRRQEMAEDDW